MTSAIEHEARVHLPVYARQPLVITRGEGCWVWDDAGRKYLDLVAGIAVNVLGHAHPAVADALAEQARTLVTTSNLYYTVPQLELADALLARSPFDRAFFTNSGTEANEAAIKLARFHTRRLNLIAFFGAFHGRSMGSLSLTASKLAQRKGFSPLVPGVFHVPYANCYRCPVNATPDTCAAECLRFLEEQTLVHIVSPDEVAAIVVEPIQGEGGYIVPPDVFHERLRELTRTHGMLLIVDEVQSGMGRTGKWFAIEHTGVEPDMVATAKGIASGLPLGVLIARSELMSWPPGAHASTFGGNPVAIAASLKTIELIEDQYMENAAKMGEHLMESLSDWRARHPLVGDIRGKGLMVGVELVKNRVTKEHATEERNHWVKLAFENGLLVLGCGLSTLRLMPPLMINKRQIPKEQLPAEFKAIYDPRPEKILFVKGDPEVKYQDIIWSMDVARGGGVKVIGIPPKDAGGGAAPSK